jgi:hypothetical protein
VCKAESHEFKPQLPFFWMEANHVTPLLVGIALCRTTKYRQQSAYDGQGYYLITDHPRLPTQHSMYPNQYLGE